MSKKSIFIFMVAFMYSLAFASYNDYDCQVAFNEIGDLNLIMMSGRCMFTTPVSINLSPTNALAENAQYSVRCRVVYENKSFSRFKSNDDVYNAQIYSDIINSLLKEFVQEEFFIKNYNWFDYGALLEDYLDGEFSDRLEKQFTEYAKEKIKEAKANIKAKDQRRIPNIDIVTVEVMAESMFREDLEDLFKEKEQGSQKTE